MHGFLTGVIDAGFCKILREREAIVTLGWIVIYTVNCHYNRFSLKGLAQPSINNSRQKTMLLVAVWRAGAGVALMLGIRKKVLTSRICIRRRRRRRLECPDCKMETSASIPGD